VYTNPRFGIILNFKSAITIINATHLINPRDSYLENSTEKTLTVSRFTLKTVILFGTISNSEVRESLSWTGSIPVEDSDYGFVTPDMEGCGSWIGYLRLFDCNIFVRVFICIISGIIY
jgi:hypothetical protein